MQSSCDNRLFSYRASSEGKYEGKIRRAKTVIDNNDLTFWYTDKVHDYRCFH